jgi:hypothetical protein
MYDKIYKNELPKHFSEIETAIGHENVKLFLKIVEIFIFLV